MKREPSRRPRLLLPTLLIYIYIYIYTHIFVYIYIYIYIHHQHQVVLIALITLSLFLSLSCHSNQSAGWYPLSAPKWGMYVFLVSQYWLTHTKESTIESRSLVRPYVTCSAQFVFNVLLGWAAAILWVAASRIYSKQHAVSLCRFHQTFSSILQTSKTGNHSIILTRLQLGRILVLFYQRDQINNQSIAVHGFRMSKLTSPLEDEILQWRWIDFSENRHDISQLQDKYNWEAGHCEA